MPGVEKRKAPPSNVAGTRRLMNMAVEMILPIVVNVWIHCLDHLLDRGWLPHRNAPLGQDSKRPSRYIPYS